MLAMQAETGDQGSAFSRFPRGGSEVSFSSPALDGRQGVSIKHVRIKQECCVKKVITVGVQ
jgi:hypothetical protein